MEIFIRTLYRASNGLTYSPYAKKSSRLSGKSATIIIYPIDIIIGAIPNNRSSQESAIALSFPQPEDVLKTAMRNLFPKEDWR